VSVRLLTSDLGRWDQLDRQSIPDALVLTLFEDERPLRGAGGLCDWRLGGRLSRLLEEGRLLGKLHEVTLLPPGRKLPFPRIVLYGLGPSQGGGFDDGRVIEVSRRVVDVLDGLGVSRVALVLPGRSLGRVSARRALELWQQSVPSGRGQRLSEVLVVESASGYKELAEVLRR
jgi:hypothetical protein